MKLNVCACFGYTIEDSAKLFSITELFVSIYNFVAFISLVSLIATYPDRIQTENVLSFCYTLFILLLAIGLFIQVILGVMLYFVGWIKRNISICYVWIVIALVNFALFFLIWLTGLVILSMAYSEQQSSSNSTTYNWFDRGYYREPYYCWHLSYNVFGAILMFNFIKWAKNTGVAVRFSAVPASSTSNTKQEQVASETAVQEEKAES